MLPPAEKDEIEEVLHRLYHDRWRDKVSQLRVFLAGKSWIGFDLDDTLHEFRRASAAASTRTLAAISQKYGTPLPALKEQYSKVLQEKTSNALSDGKSSSEYRRERFSAVLVHFSLPLDASFMEQLLETYETTLKESLELKHGAIKLLSTIRSLDKKIVVITEGPQDAQERTLQDLGIATKIDFLATTNFFLVTKTNGLYQKVLEHLNISAADMVYVGDNEQRDMKPAIAEGIFCIHFDETKPLSLNSRPPRINNLKILDYILSG